MATGLDRLSFVPCRNRAETIQDCDKLQPSQAADTRPFFRDAVCGAVSGYQRRAAFVPWVCERQCMTCSLFRLLRNVYILPLQRAVAHPRLRPLSQGPASHSTALFVKARVGGYVEPLSTKGLQMSVVRV